MALYQAALYQAIGGAATCRKLAEAFYARVDRDPLLRPLFPERLYAAPQKNSPLSWSSSWVVRLRTPAAAGG